MFLNFIPIFYPHIKALSCVLQPLESTYFLIRETADVLIPSSVAPLGHDFDLGFPQDTQHPKPQSVQLQCLLLNISGRAFLITDL